MLKLNPKVDLDQFFLQLRASPRAILFLDYDGTLAPFHIDPKKALPYPGVVELLQNIVESGKTRLIILTGRAIKDFLPLMPLKPMPEVWGSHGSERLTTDQQYTLINIRESHKKSLQEGSERAQKVLPKEKCESKPTSIAAHWRGMDESTIQSIKKELLHAWQPLQLDIKEFNGGLELRIPGINKGVPIDYILNEEKDVPIAYIGDDVTDEDAFERLPEAALKVGVKRDNRKTFADIQIALPEELIDFLTKWEENHGR